MLIPGIPAGLQAIAAILDFGSPESQAVEPSRPEPPFGQRPFGSDAIRGLAEQFDLRNITPRDLSGLLRELKRTGAIDAQQWRDLSQLAFDEDLATVDQDRQVDLLQLLAKKLEKLPAPQADAQESAADVNAIDRDTARRQLEWLTKFQQLRETSPLDVTA